jgi:NTE family protein
MLGGRTLLEEVVTTILVGRDQAYLNQPWVSARTIRIDTREVGVLDFNLSQADKQLLYEDGAQAGREFLATWNWPGYLKRFR